MTTSKRVILKKTWQLASTLTLSRSLIMLASFLGVMMIARISHTTLAASGLISATQALIFVVSMSMLFSIGPVVGHAFSGGRKKEVGSIFQQACLLAIVIGLIGTMVMLHVKTILLAFHQDPQLVTIVQSYFHMYIFGFTPMMIMMACQQIVLATNKQKFVLFTSLWNLTVMLFLAYVLIYGKFGVHRFGVPGLSLAYAINAWIVLGIYFIYLKTDPSFKKYDLFTWRISSNFHIFKKLVKIGWPITLQGASDLFSFFIVVIMVGWIGEYALAAQQIVTQYFLLLVIPLFGLSQASSILIGQARGAKAYTDVKAYGNTVLCIGFGFSIFVVIAFVLFPRELIMLYLSESHPEHINQIIHLARIVLIMTGFRILFDSSVEILVGSLRGLYDTKWPMMLSIILTWAFGIPLAYVLGFILKWGLVGITISGILGMIIISIILWYRWMWQNKKLATC